LDSKTKTAPLCQLRGHLLPQGEKGKYLQSFFEGIDTTTAGDSYNRTWAGLGVFYIKTYKMPEGAGVSVNLAKNITGNIRYDGAFSGGSKFQPLVPG